MRGALPSGLWALWGEGVLRPLDSPEQRHRDLKVGHHHLRLETQGLMVTGTHSSPPSARTLQESGFQTCLMVSG